MILVFLVFQVDRFGQEVPVALVVLVVLLDQPFLGILLDLDFLQVLVVHCFPVHRSCPVVQFDLVPQMVLVVLENLVVL